MTQTGNASRFAPPASTPNAAEVAAQKAQEIAAKLSKTLTGSAGSVQAWPVSGGGANSVILNIPVEKVGLVIGKAGTMIREIQESSGARLQLDSTGEPTRILRISGAAQSVEIAKARVEGLMNQPTYGLRISKPSKTMQIPSECVGFVIGKGGETIKRISQDTRCRMQIETEEEALRLGHTPPMPGHQNLQLVGSAEAVANAEAVVTDLLQRKQGMTGNVGGAYGATQQQSYQLRAQPYPAYVPPQGYAQVAQQAYALSAQGYQPNQMQGYGAYTPQYAAYASQAAPPQSTPGYPQPGTSATQQPYISYPTPQQPNTGNQPTGQPQEQNPQHQSAGQIPGAQSSMQNAQHISSGQMGPNYQQGNTAGVAPNSQTMPPAYMPYNAQHMNPGMSPSAGMPNKQINQMGVPQSQTNSSVGNPMPNISQQAYPGTNQY